MKAILCRTSGKNGEKEIKVTYLRDLIKIMEETKCDLVLALIKEVGAQVYNRLRIEIYDDYRE